MKRLVLLCVLCVFATFALTACNPGANELKDYNAIKNRESQSPYAGLVGDDYKLIISLDELADRTAATYKFLASYPNSTHKDEIAKWRDEYLHQYLSDNFKYSSSFNWLDGSNAFYSQYLESYRNSIKKYAGTEFAKLLDEYVKLISSEGNKMTDKVRAFVESHSSYSGIIFKLPS